MELLSDDRCPAAALAATVLSCAVSALRVMYLSFCNPVRHDTRHVYVWSNYYSAQHAFAPDVAVVRPSQAASRELLQRHSHQPIGNGRR
jgi:hypothetical protein